MDLNKLKTFLVVAECGSMSLAAEKLYRTQPAISQQLKQLEKDTGLLLFERKQGRIFLSREGQQLYDFAHSRVQALEEQPLIIRQALSETEGVIRIGTLKLFGQEPLATIVRQFQAQHPRVRFEIRSYDHVELDAALLNNEVDLALMIWFEDRSFFEIEPVFTFTRSLVASRQYLDQLTQPVHLEDLPKLQIIEASWQMSDTLSWLNIYAPDRMKTLPSLKPYLVSSEVDIYHRWVLEGAGVGLVLDYLLVDAYKAGDIRPLFNDSQPVYVTLDLARRKRQNRSLAEAAFWDFAQTSITHWSENQEHQ